MAVQKYKTIDYLIAGSRSLFSSIRNIRTSFTHVANQGYSLANFCTVVTQLTALIFAGSPKYTLPCCHVKLLASMNFLISPHALLYDGLW